MYILSNQNVYDMEQYTIKSLSISEDILMENAGIAVFNHIIKFADKNKTIAVLAGPGNNGGDGFVIFRHLISHGYKAVLYYSFNDKLYTGSAKTNLEILKKQTVPIYSLEQAVDLSYYHIIIDALFGIGLQREINGIYKDIIENANNTNALRISVDIASGLYCDNPNIYGTVFKADYTVTFSCYKYCHVLYPAKYYSGEVICANITIPNHIIKRYNSSILIEKNNLPKLIERKPYNHKGNFGKVALIGGSQEMAGAIKISAISALYSGCGLISVIHPNTIDRNFLSNIPEIMTKAFDINSPDDVTDFINNTASVYTIGNGMGRSKEIKRFILNILENTKKPVIIDADAINALSLDDFKKIKSQKIITPHIQEFARLINKNIDEVMENKIELSCSFAKNYNTILILKSADTIIACPDNNIFIINEGNTSLSKGGSGDALTGLIASLTAQKYSAVDACILSCYILGKSAEKACINKHAASLSITEIIQYYGEVFSEL